MVEKPDPGFSTLTISAEVSEAIERIVKSKNEADYSPCVHGAWSCMECWLRARREFWAEAFKGDRRYGP